MEKKLLMGLTALVALLLLGLVARYMFTGTLDGTLLTALSTILGSLITGLTTMGRKGQHQEDDHET